MKKLNSKLTLNKETIVSLDNNEMNSIQGGLLSIGAVCHSNKHPTDCATVTNGCGGCAKH